MTAVATATLAGKGALVTGASIQPGIGFAIAEALAAAGADIVLSSRREADAEALSVLKKHGVRASCRAAGLTDSGQIAALIDYAEETLEGIDFLVDNAGTNHPNLIEDIPPADWDDVIAGETAGQIRGATLAMDGGWTAH